MSSDDPPPTRRQLLLLIAEADAADSLAQSTKSQYLCAMNLFLAFCLREALPPVPNIHTLCMYISDACRRVSPRTNKPLAPSTVTHYLSGIAASFEHIHPDIRSITNSKQVRSVLRGCKVKFSLPVTRKDPLTLVDLIHVSHSLDQSYDSLLFAAMLLTGFHGLHRLGELTVPDVVRYRNPRKIINRASFTFSRCGGYVKYLLPHCKTDPYFQGSTVLISSCAIEGACAVTALKAFLLRRDACFSTTAPLFLTIHGLSPSRAWFLRHF